MRIVTKAAAMRRLAGKWKAGHVKTGFVPTMGCLHAGHLSLVKKARALVGKDGVVIVSIYVNPTQFAPNEDLARYPRDLDQDKKLCREAGVDVIFAPSDQEMYPPGFSTYVVEEKLGRLMEGASRPTHFRGVTTVVAKLFNLVLPDVAVFGAKDYQQAAIVKQMVRDLNFPVRIVVAPTFRESNGLAMSSRNRYLSASQRMQATVLRRSMGHVSNAVADVPISAGTLREAIGKIIGAQPEARLDYVEFFDPETLEPVDPVKPGARMALAVFIGKTRLIDNLTL